MLVCLAVFKTVADGEKRSGWRSIPICSRQNQIKPGCVASCHTARLYNYVCGSMKIRGSSPVMQVLVLQQSQQKPAQPQKQEKPRHIDQGEFCEVMLDIRAV